MFTLEEITTEEGLILQGIVSYPEKAGTTALIWVHGLTSTFYNNVTVLTTLAKKANEKNIAIASFNTRGHDMITGIKRKDAADPKGYQYLMAGAGYEVFEECIADIEAVIHFLSQQGYKKIILIEHSTGANKVCFYTGVKKNPNLKGAVLLCPMSDRLDPRANKQEIEENLKKCTALVESGREDALVTTVSFSPMTAKRYVSLVTPHSAEDQFGYGDTPPVMNDFEKITVPLFVLFAQNDEYADRPIPDIKKVFDEKNKSISYQSTIIPNATHTLKNTEERVAGDLVDWAASI